MAHNVNHLSESFGIWEPADVTGYPATKILYKVWYIYPIQG